MQHSAISNSPMLILLLSLLHFGNALHGTYGGKQDITLFKTTTTLYAWTNFENISVDIKVQIDAQTREECLNEAYSIAKTGDIVLPDMMKPSDCLYNMTQSALVKFDGGSYDSPNDQIQLKFKFLEKASTITLKRAFVPPDPPPMQTPAPPPAPTPPTPPTPPSPRPAPSPQPSPSSKKKSKKGINLVDIAGAGGVLALVAGVMVLYSRRQKSSLSEEGQEGLLPFAVARSK
jgi:hypothetical protein